MVSYEKTAAVVAVLVVLATVGAGFLTTGAATADNNYDFYVKSVTYPQTIYPNTLTATRAVVGNRGTQSAAFVYYKYTITDERGAKVFESGDDTYLHTMPAGSESRKSLSSVMLSLPGTYKARVELNWDKIRGYEEANKADNVFETTFVVQKTG